MKIFNTIKIIFLFILVVVLSNVVSAQNEKESRFSAHLGADIVSRYIFRGIDFSGDPATPHFQPAFSIGYKLGEGSKIEFGGWGSYGFNSQFMENDLLLKYSYTSEKIGKLSLTLNDFTFPHTPNFDYTSFDNDGNGAHYIDVTFSYIGSEKLPFTFTASTLLYNLVPDDKGLYLEIGYNFNINNVSANFHIGAAQGKSQWNQINSEGFQFNNIGFDLSKEVKITEDYSIPVGVSYYLNYHLRKSYLVFKISI